MSCAFVPGRLVFTNSFLRRSTYMPIFFSTSKRTLAQASLSAREKRRAIELARTAAHRDIKRELENREGDLLNAIVSVPGFVRQRCSLTPRLGRVKVFLDKDDITDVDLFKGRVRSGLVRLFPELEDRGLLTDSDGFDMKVGGGDVVRDHSGLLKGVEKCEKVGTVVFVEVIPHNVPPPRPPLSPRVEEVISKVATAARDPDAQLHMISFYKFVKLQNPTHTSELLGKALSKLGVKGRVYVASEGVNAQLAVPGLVLQDFYDAMNGSWWERGESFIPSELTGVFLNTDSVVFRNEQPFQKLSVRPREKVLADGLDEALDWNKAGKEVPPEEWHSLVTQNSDDVIILDCRNNYESDVGRFEGAEPLNTRTFRESWDFLEQRLKHEEKNKKILTYCTGGIRCVKVNAYLEQKMGFKNTGRLEGGIVSYARSMREQSRLGDSVFKGVNHVFDGRMGEVITDDLLDRCIHCQQACNVQTDCANVACPRPFDKRMFLQCEDCASIMRGACCRTCRQAIAEQEPSLRVERGQRESIFTFSRERTISDAYADKFTVAEDALLLALREKTERSFPGRVHMLSGHVQASLLNLLVKITKSRRILEIGTFTGYATIAMASALPHDGEVTTCELDHAAADVAEEFFERRQCTRPKIVLQRGNAHDILLKLVEDDSPQFDLIFVDANKGGYEAYLECLLCNKLVRLGGLLIFDNVLFRGEVARVWSQEQRDFDHVTEAETHSLVKMNPRNLKNANKTARKLHTFNDQVRQDPRVEQVLLPFRDGLTLARRVQ